MTWVKCYLIRDRNLSNLYLIENSNMAEWIKDFDELKKQNHCEFFPHHSTDLKDKCLNLVLKTFSTFFMQMIYRFTFRYTDWLGSWGPLSIDANTAQQVVAWANQLGLKLNTGKTRAMFFGSSRYVQRLNEINSPGISLKLQTIWFPLPVTLKVLGSC